MRQFEGRLDSEIRLLLLARESTHNCWHDIVKDDFDTRFLQPLVHHSERTLRTLVNLADAVSDARNAVRSP